MQQSKRKFLVDRIYGLLDESIAVIIIGAITAVISYIWKIKRIQEIVGYKVLWIIPIIIILSLSIVVWRKRKSFRPKSYTKNNRLHKDLQNTQTEFNPFVVGPPVSGKNFFNRDAVINSIYEMLSKNECCSIDGNRRIGKTSILGHLCYEGTIKKNGVRLGIHLKNDIFIYLYTAAYKDETECWKGILYKLVEFINIPDKNSYLDHPDFEHFENIIKKLNERGSRLFLLFDEFDAAFQTFGNQFLSRLRSLPGQYQIAYVITTLAPLSIVKEKIEINKKISSFLNIFHRHLRIDLFTENESEEMLSIFFNRITLEIQKKDIQFLICIAGPHPFFLQMAGDAYYLAMKDIKFKVTNIDDIIYKKIKDQFVSSAYTHFKYYYDKLPSNNYRQVLIQIAKSSAIMHKKEILEVLFQRSLIREKNRKIIPFSECFQEFLIEQIPLINSK